MPDSRPNFPGCPPTLPDSDNSDSHRMIPRNRPTISARLLPVSNTFLEVLLSLSDMAECRGTTSKGNARWEA